MTSTHYFTFWPDEWWSHLEHLKRSLKMRLGNSSRERVSILDDEFIRIRQRYPTRSMKPSRSVLNTRRTFTWKLCALCGWRIGRGSSRGFSIESEGFEPSPINHLSPSNAALSRVCFKFLSFNFVPAESNFIQWILLTFYKVRFTALCGENHSLRESSSKGQRVVESLGPSKL